MRHGTDRRQQWKQLRGVIVMSSRDKASPSLGTHGILRPALKEDRKETGFRITANRRRRSRNNGQGAHCPDCETD